MRTVDRELYYRLQRREAEITEFGAYMEPILIKNYDKFIDQYYELILESVIERQFNPNQKEMIEINEDSMEAYNLIHLFDYHTMKLRLFEVLEFGYSITDVE